MWELRLMYYVNYGIFKLGVFIEIVVIVLMIKVWYFYLGIWCFLKVNFKLN